jgi:uncharacterized protein YcbK (DUF882 family)
MYSDVNQSPGSGHMPYSAFQLFMWNELEDVRSEFDNEPIIIDSGYRCPHGNAAVGGAGQSRHMWGDAVDMHSQGTWNHDAWLDLQAAAVAAGASFIEPYSQDPSHVHADWR